MISDNQSICPKCGGQLKYYDHVQRLVRTKFGNKKWVAIRRLRCCKCHAVHRELPDFIFPYKHNNLETQMLIGLAHDRIIYLGMAYIERGYITQDEYENLYEYLYKPYEKLGGNGSAKRIMTEVDQLAIHKSTYNA